MIKNLFVMLLIGSIVVFQTSWSGSGNAASSFVQNGDSEKNFRMRRPRSQRSYFTMALALRRLTYRPYKAF